MINMDSFKILSLPCSLIGPTITNYNPYYIYIFYAHSLYIFVHIVSYKFHLVNYESLLWHLL
jgi:hypothetical protein